MEVNEQAKAGGGMLRALQQLSAATSGRVEEGIRREQDGADFGSSSRRTLLLELQSDQTRDPQLAPDRSAHLPIVKAFVGKLIRV